MSAYHIINCLYERLSYHQSLIINASMPLSCGPVFCTILSFRRYPAHLSGEIAHGDILIEVNGKMVGNDARAAAAFISGAFAECAQGQTLPRFQHVIDDLYWYTIL